jgi:FkbM family methyltransferase
MMNDIKLEYALLRAKRMVTPDFLFPWYKRFLVTCGGHGLGRFRAVRAAEGILRSALRPRTADVLGHKMFLDSSDTLQLSRFGEYETFQTAIIHKLVKKGTLVLDIGANIGYYTLLFARLVGGEGRVIAFEPNLDNFAVLQRNVKLNGYSNVRPERKAVSDVNAELKLYISEINKGDHRIYDSGDGRRSTKVESVRLDDYLSNVSQSISLIKMDVQGAEGAVLQGMEKLLARNRDVRIITELWPAGMHRAGFTPERYLSMLAGQGFFLYHINEDERRIEPTTVEQICASGEGADEHYYTNLLATRNPVEIDSLLG